MRNTIISSIRQGIRNTIGNILSSLRPVFHWPGQYTLAATTGTDPTFTRATAATFEDFEGLIRTADSSEPRFVGARRVHNVKGAFSASDWDSADTGVKTNTTVTTGISDPNGGTDAITVTATAASGLYRTSSASGTLFAGQTVIHSIWVRRRTGTGVVQMTGNGNGYSAADDITSALTTSWQRFSTVAGVVVSYFYIGFKLVNDTDEIDIAFSQPEEVTGQTNQNPSEYVSTGVGTGAEMATNGDFSNGTTGWAALTAGTTLSVVSGELTVQNAADYGYAYQQIAVVTGRTYVLTFDVTDTGSGTKVLVKVGPTSGSTAYVTPDSMLVGTHTYTFTVTSDTLHLRFGNAFFQASTSATFDNISVKEASHGANIDGVQYFNTLNANTVTAGVVTEATGSAITSATTQFMELDGVSGTYVSTPDSAANSVTGSMTLIAWVAMDDWTPSTAQSFIAKFESTGNQYSYLFRCHTNGTLKLSTSADGSSADIATSTASTGFAAGTGHWVRVTFDDSADTVDFYTSDQPVGTSVSSLVWTQLGSQIAHSSAGVYDSTAPLEIGAADGGASRLTGKVSRAVVIASTDPTATPAVDFNANDWVAGKTWENYTGGIGTLTNGGFDTDSDWVLDNDNLGGTQTISGGQLTLTQGTSAWMNSSQAIDVSGLSSIRLSGTMVSATAASNKRFGLATTAESAATPDLGYVATTATSETDLTLVVDVSAYSTVYVHITDGQPDNQSSIWDNITTEALSGNVWTMNGAAKAFAPLSQNIDVDGTSDGWTSPDSAAASITGDIFLAGWGAPDDWTPAADMYICAKYNAATNDKSYALGVDSTGVLNVASSSNGSTDVLSQSDTAVGFTNGTLHGFAVSLDLSENTATYYTAPAEDCFKPHNKVRWTQFGDPVAHVQSAIFDSAALLTIGGFSDTVSISNWTGRIMRAYAIASTDPTVQPAWDFDARALTAGVTTGTMPTGEVWTAVGNGTIEAQIPAPWDASGPFGYLAEGARTNICLQSNAFDTTWTKGGGSRVTSTYAIAPDGTNTAWQLLDSGATGVGEVYVYQFITVASGSSTYSIYVKEDQLNFVSLQTLDFDAGGNGTSFFNLATGAWGTQSANHTVHSQSLGNGWYRIAVSLSTTSDLAGRVLVYCVATDGSNNNVPLDGTSSILIWGAQLEAGTFPSSYIATAAAAVTRNSDLLTAPAAGSGTFPMTLSADVTPSQIVGTSDIFLGLDNGATIPRAQIGAALGLPRLLVSPAGGGNSVLIDGTEQMPLGATTAIVGAISETSSQLYVDGSPVGPEDTSSALPTTLSTLRIGSRWDTGSQPYGNIRNVKIFDERLTDAEVADL